MSQLNNKVDLVLGVDNAVILSRKDQPYAKLSPTLRLRYHDSNEKTNSCLNIGEGNVRFYLNQANGSPICELTVKTSDQFELIENGQESEWSCQLTVDDQELAPNQTYQLRADAFGKTETTDFEFA